MYLRLRDLIRAVRVSKTAADERSIIQKESAGIRTSFKESNSQDVRFSNIQKLLYIYLLGYPVQFGQLECLKLVASNKYSDKRVGYLGVMVLLDESQEIMTLLTNSLKNDLQSSDDYITGLALCTLSVIGSEEASRDLVDDVVRLIGSSRSFIRKKAVLAALRIVRKVPEFIDTFMTRSRSLLGDKNHGVQISAVALLSEMCTSNPNAMETVQKMVPIIVRQLRSLLNSVSNDHDVAGINDPFLQIGFLKLLRLLGSGSVVVADEINDVLTQVMTQTDESKNAGTSVLYECIKVVLAIPSEKSLRVLAINLLGKFLEHKDNNIRYVALTMLLQAMVTESSSVLRVQSTIVHCIRDSDVSIRRHALDLTFALINKNNVRKLTTELLDLFPEIDIEFRKKMAHKLFVVAELFSHSPEYCMDVKLKTLYLSGKDLSVEDMSWFITEISNQDKYDTNLKRYATRFAFSGLTKRFQNIHSNSFDPDDKFIIVAAWLLGEFGELAIDNNASLALDRNSLTNENLFGFSLETPSPRDIVDILDKIFEANNYASQVSLTSLAKLCGRNLLDDSLKSFVLNKLKMYLVSSNSELQTRSVHYIELFKDAPADLVMNVTDKMPAPVLPLPKITSDELNPAMIKFSNISEMMRIDDSNGDLLNDSTSASDSPKLNPTTSVSIVNDLLGLMDDTPQTQAIAHNPSNTFTHSPQNNPKVSSLIDDLVSMTMEAGSSQSSAPAQTLDIFGDIGINNTMKAMETSTHINSSNGLHGLNDILSAGNPPNISNVSPNPSPAYNISSNTPKISENISTIPPSAFNTNTSLESTLNVTTDNEVGFNHNYTAYSKNGLIISLTPSKSATNPDIIDILSNFENSGSETISNLNFQVAVPRSLKLQMLPPSGNSIEPNSGNVTQIFRISNPSKAQIRLRMKISFRYGSNSFDEIAEFGSFGSIVV
ncbi:AP-1 complex subunit gamma-1 [Smittium culicis]|uniref:AP-1 complex subunit gamma n=1 Tax=Smittium culicis TaxID=133412 RepID=A0A1R1Y585_9FUNG|nr:AP-1 complex subunit gamma-1 [Smittium culicis]